MGSGGVARSCAYILSNNGSKTVVTGRNMDEVRKIASEFSVNAAERNSVDVKGYDLIVNCVPLHKGDRMSEYPVNIGEIHSSQIVFDIVYGDTHLYDIASDRKCTTLRGEDVLAYQGIKAFELFTSKSVPFGVMRDVI